MKCEEAQSRLSEYLENTLDPESARELVDHLASCSLCRAEGDQLADSIRCVAGLPAVDPPIGFAGRVMAQVREISHKPSLWERLFLPWKIKIPVHATAFVLIGVLAVYIYQSEQRHDSAPATLEQDRYFQKNNESYRDREAANRTAIPAGKKAKESNRPSAETETGEPKEAQEKIVRSLAPPGPSSAPALKESPKFAEGRRADDRKGEFVGGGTANQRSIPAEVKTDHAAETAGSAAKPGLEPSREKSSALDALRGGAAGSTRAEAGSDYDLVMKLREERSLGDLSGALRKQPERESFTFRDELKEIGRVRQRAAESKEPQTLWLSIPHGRYEQFKKDLAAFGTVESESRLSSGDKEPASKLTDEIRIKLTILPPDSSKSTPSR